VLTLSPGLGYRVTSIDVTPDIAAALTAAKPDIALNVLHGRPGEDGTLQGVLENPRHSLQAIPASWPRPSPCRRISPKYCSVPPACRSPTTGWCRASKRPRAISLARPYVIKPVAEARASAFFIVTEAHPHPPQELYRDDWAFGERVMVGALHPRKGADLRRARRPGARRYRDRAGDAVSTTTRQNTPPAAPNTCYRRKFYQMFTRKSADSVWLPITRLAAAA